MPYKIKSKKKIMQLLDDSRIYEYRPHKFRAIDSKQEYRIKGDKFKEK